MGQSCWSKDKDEDGRDVSPNPPIESPDTRYAQNPSEPVSKALTHPGLHKGGAYCVERITEHMVATGGEDGGICLVDFSAKTPHVVKSIADSNHTDDTRRLYYHRKTQLLASSSRDATIKTWQITENPSSLVERHTFKGHTLTVANVCMNESGDKMASGSRDNTVRLWDTEHGRHLCMQQTARNLVHCLAWVDEHTVIQGGENLKLYIWDVRGDRLDTHGKAITGVPDQPVCMTKHPVNQNQIYVGYKGFTEATAVIRLWDVRMEKALLSFSGHDKCISDIAFEEGTMGSAAHDRTIRVWCPDTATNLSTTSLMLDGAPTDFTLFGSRAVVTTTEGEVCVYQNQKESSLFELEHKFADTE